MTQQLVVIGAGGFGREVVDVVEAINLERSTVGTAYEVLGFFDDGDADLALLEPYGLPHLGPVASVHDLPRDVAYVIGIGNPQVRARLDDQFMDERPSVTLVHPDATVTRLAELGPGTVVCAGARITNHVTLGRHVHVNLNATIGHDARVSDYVTLSPLVALSGNVRAEARAFFGTGALVNPGLRVGEDAVVGTGAAVVREVESKTTVVGVPAKPRG